MKTATHLISAIHTGARAWVEQREPPPVESLALPEKQVGSTDLAGIYGADLLEVECHVSGILDNILGCIGVANYKTPANNGLPERKCGSLTRLRQFGAFATTRNTAMIEISNG
jgi:hypothetical protein